MAIELVKAELGASNSIGCVGDLISYMDCASVKEFMDTVVEYLPKGELSAEKIEQLTEKSLIDILRQVPYANNVIDENVGFYPYQ